MSSMPSKPIAPISAAAGAVQRFFDDPTLDQAVKDQIVRLLPSLGVAQVAALVEGNFNVTVSRAEILAVWNERQARRTAEPAAEQAQPDKETLHPADQPQECLLTLPAAAPDTLPPFAIATDPAPTRTGPGQKKKIIRDPAVEKPVELPVEIKDAATDGMNPTEPKIEQETLPAEVREFIIARMARHSPPWAIANDVERDFGFVLDRDEVVVCWRDRDAHPTRTGPGPEQESRPRLSDEIKAFIVKRLACYETPSRVAAAVRINFGIDVDRRRIFDYDPKGTRPPAQRWIDLHAATRARFLQETSDIGIAQKVIRLRMLDRMAETAEEDNLHDKAAKYLAQAARECGGFYDKQPLMQRQPGSAHAL